MDSQLLNVFHDDPFDGSFVKYEDNNTDFWTGSSETLGLQLSETLHGILPIAPAEEDSLIYDNTILKNEYMLEYKNENVESIPTENMLIYEDFTQHNVSTSGAIEIITVNPDDEDSGNDDSDSDNESEYDNNFEEIDTHSQHSYATFRSRTDSSSIGDYESHSSDYDDEDSYNNGVDKLIASNTAIKLTSEGNNCFISKNRTLSTNTIGSDVDGLGLQIDANNFDLAEFITKDDFSMANSFPKPTKNKGLEVMNTRTHSDTVNLPPDAAPVQIISSHKADSDSDSDVIVDVETVELNGEEENQILLAKLNSERLKEVPENSLEDITLQGYVCSESPWTPNGKINQKKETTNRDIKTTESIPVSIPLDQNNQNLQLQQKFSRNFSVVPSKRQCDILKGKFSNGRVKNTTIQLRNQKMGISKPFESKLESSKTLKKESIVGTEGSNILLSGQTTLSKPATELKQMNLGVGRGGKNLSLIKHDCNSILDQSSEADKTPEKLSNVQLENKKSPKEPLERHAVKRKLNLEEYKKRIGERKCESLGINKLPSSNTSKQDSVALNNHIPNKTPRLLQKINPNATCKNNTEIASIVQSLKEQAKQPQKVSLDPITEAKNKVLRMQELKKAQLLKIIDSTVSAKVPRVTKVLPLKDMVNNSNGKCAGTTVQSNKNTLKINEEYEEIVIVSASSNTTISIPPINILPNDKQHVGALKLGVNNASRSLLKSSVLLHKISNTFQKVKECENVKLTSNSLITSIQNVVVKQTSCASGLEYDGTALGKVLEEELVSRKSGDPSLTEVFVKNEINAGQHGEDKIIMHLRKDRIRNPTCTISTQTDILVEFPPLVLPSLKYAAERKSRERKRRKRAARNYRVQRRLESSDKFHKESGSEISSCCEDSRSYRSRSRSCTGDVCSSSPEYYRKLDGVSGGGYSSRSSRRHRSSISSSYSESERKPICGNRKYFHRNHKSKSFKRHGRFSSSSSSDFSDRSRSRNRSRNCSRSCSRSPLRRSRSRSCTKRFFQDRNVSQPAVEERRIVYVGRIEQETNKEMLRRKFIVYGPIKQITIHYKETGMKYGFVTYERSQDAFNVIDNSAKDSRINMYDISFGGRRAFCRASYADLDNAGINTYQSYVFPKTTIAAKEEDSFEALLLKVKAKLNASKMSNNVGNSTSKI